MTQPQDDKKPKQPARTHPDDRARIATLNAVGKTLRGTPAEKPPTSYYTPALIQCTLPHSDPKENHWIRKNGNYSLIIQGGIDEEGTSIGVPYGSFPRLVLAYIITYVVETKERRVDLSNHFGGFLREIGYSPKTNRRGDNVRSKTIKGQLLRLLRANITFQYREGNQEQGGIAVSDVKVAPKFSLWWDYKKPEQTSLFESYIDLSEDFYNSILANPVPLKTDVLSALKRSPLALDVYMWVSYRLFTMQASGQEQITLGYGRLQEQFGTGISEKNYRQFRRELKLAFAKVAQHWKSPEDKLPLNEDKPLLNYELHEDGLTLFRSPLLINVPRRKIAENAAEAEAARILTSKKFDDLTIKQARQVAGERWDVKTLQAQYFAWIESKSITPKDPRAHFLAFIKRHRQRNEN